MKPDFKKKLICGILNVTPDSFSDGGFFYSHEKAVLRALEMEKEGAGLVDIGGESSRPFSEPVSPKEELRRVIPVISEIRKRSEVPISIDTCKASVAAKALEAGADMINDIKGLSSPEMAEVAASRKVPAVIMHMKGEPKNMQSNPDYSDAVSEIMFFFEERISFLSKKGVKELVLDPGIGFGKKTAHNLYILNSIEKFLSFGFPIMVGVSRKSYIGEITGEKEPLKRLPGTIASCVLAFSKGANIFRVHDVKECVQALLVSEKILSAGKDSR